jgi:Fe-S-cluster containining protein
MQDDHDGIKCKNLNLQDGRCGIYTHRPFSCDFELIRFLVSVNPEKRKNQMTQKLFGRGWNMLRVDGERGALCEMTPPDIKSVSEVKRKLNRLKMWTDYFGVVDTKIPKVLEWIESQIDYTNVQPLFLTKTGDITNG